MNRKRTLTASFALMLALTAPALAGHIGTGKTDPPPPPTANGGIHTGVTDGAGGVTQTGEARVTSGTTSVTEIALSLLGNVLSLF